MEKLNYYEQTMLNAIIFTAQEFKESGEDIISALDTINLALKALYESDLYKEELNK